MALVQSFDTLRHNYAWVKEEDIPELLLAAKTGKDIDEVKTVIEEGAIVSKGEIIAAINSDNVEMAKLFINNFDVKGDGNNHIIMMKAISKGHTDVVELLLKKGCNLPGGTDSKTLYDEMLSYAAEHNQLDIVKLLMKHGATEYDHGLLGAAMACDHPDNVEIIKLMMSQPVDIQADYDEQVEIAVEHGNVKAVELMVSNTTMNGRNSALEMAASNGRYRIAEILLDHGVTNHERAVEVANKNRFVAIAEMIESRIK